MVNWVLITVGLIGLFIFFKTKDVKHRFITLIFLAIFLFFIFTFPAIINGEDNDLDTFDGVGKTAKLYLSWLKQISINLIEVTGNALKLDWAGNFTNSEDSK